MGPEDVRLVARLAVSIFLEAAPFLLLGSLAAAAVERLTPPAAILRRLPRHAAGRVAVGLAGGLLFPICECGAVPVARRLLGKGVPAETAITFMLAAPGMNPIVMLSTYVAFGGSLKMALARAALVALSAALAGRLIGRRIARKASPPAPPSLPRGALLALDLPSAAAAEFLDMGKFLILGAVASALLKVLLPWELIRTLGAVVPLAIGSLMLLAIALSVCSEADAFVAASLVYFPPPAQLAFIAIGPMVDLKLAAMYFSAFGRQTALRLILIPVAGVFLVSNLLVLLAE